MTLHPQARGLLDLQRALPRVEDSDPVEARALRRELVVPSTVEVAEVRDLDADGTACRLYRADAQATTGLLVWLHGGGWVLGDLDSHDDLCRSLCRRSGQAVLSVDYRLAPEHPFPAAVDDALAATAWAHEHAGSLGADPDRLAIGGDSAGGNLAAVVANSVTVPLLLQLLVYPVTDLRMRTESYEQHADDSFLTAAGMRWFVAHYLTDGSLALDPRASPALADDATLASSPPAVVITAEYDPLLDEGVAYAQRLLRAGVPTTHVHFPAQMHAFFSLATYVDDARWAHALVADALASTIGEE